MNARILLVDDELENLKALERTLRSHYEVASHLSPLPALEEIQRQEFAVVISDQRMPEMSGTEFLSRVAKLQPLSTRVILTAYTETQPILDAINRAEIYRYITKPWDNRELLTTLQQAVEHHRLKRENEELIAQLGAKNTRLENKEKELIALNQKLEGLVEERTADLKLANEKLNELAMTDPLTGVFNRRAFFNKFQEEIDRSKRYGHSIAVAMLDVDHFKPFNDMEGHVRGDGALVKISKILSERIRKSDVLCRYGGEEFALMMPETKVKSAFEICERLRDAIENNRFEGQQGFAYLTISVGLAGFPEMGKTSEQLIQASDRALYYAKESGRNRVVLGGIQ